MSGGEAVAEAANREDEFRAPRVGFQLLAVPRHVDVHGSGGRQRLVSPDLLQELVAGDDAAAVIDEVTQQVELAGGEVDGLGSSCETPATNSIWSLTRRESAPISLSLAARAASASSSSSGEHSQPPVG